MGTKRSRGALSCGGGLVCAGIGWSGDGLEQDAPATCFEMEGNFVRVEAVIDEIVALGDLSEEAGLASRICVYLMLARGLRQGGRPKPHYSL